MEPDGIDCSTRQARVSEMEQTLPTLTRRQYLKAGAAAGIAAGLSTGPAPGDLDGAVQEAEGIGLTAVGILAVAAGAGIIGAGAGYGAANLLDDDGNPDTEEIAARVVANEIHSVAATYDNLRSDKRKELKAQFPGSPNPWTAAAWSEVDVAVARSILEPENNEPQLQAAYRATDEHLLRSHMEALGYWNRALVGGEDQDGLVSSLVMDYSSDSGDDGTQVHFGDNRRSYRYDYKPGPLAPSELPDNQKEDWEPVEASAVYERWDEEKGEPGGSQLEKYAVYKYEWSVEDMPADPTQMDGVAEDDLPFHIYGLACKNGDRLGPGIIIPEDKGRYSVNASQSLSRVSFSHPERSDATAIDCSAINKWITGIESSYSNIRSGQVSEYVEKLNNALGEGIISPSDLISPTEGLREFGYDPENQASVAAQLAFSGLGVPSGEYSYTATVSHDNIEGDSLKGTLFISFDVPDGEDPPPVNAGTTIPASDYELAYLVYTRRDNGNPDTRLLLGNSDLEILNVADVNGEENVDNAPDEVDEGGEVPLYEGPCGEAPTWLQNIGNEDAESFSIIVETPNGREAVRDENIKGGGSTGDCRYRVETGIDQGTPIDSVRRTPRVTYEQPVQHVSDPGQISEERIVERVGSSRKVVREIKKIDDDDEGGGGWDWPSWPSLPSLPGMGFIESAIAVVIGFFVGIGLVNAATG